MRHLVLMVGVCLWYFMYLGLYITLCVKDYDNKVLARSDNAFALVLLIAKSALLKGEEKDEKLLRRKIMIAKLLFQKKFDNAFVENIKGRKKRTV
ncbi:MAG TPA: hypothetical protein VL727_08615 [Puia sp.]|jgi:hypothetical protein|nr:hypothetical protein [Puia sp.]